MFTFTFSSKSKQLSCTSRLKEDTYTMFEHIYICSSTSTQKIMFNGAPDVALVSFSLELFLQVFPPSSHTEHTVATWIYCLHIPHVISMISQSLSPSPFYARWVGHSVIFILSPCQALFHEKDRKELNVEAPKVCLHKIKRILLLTYTPAWNRELGR